MKKSIFLIALISFFTLNISSLSAQSSCCSKNNMSYTSCNKSCSKDKKTSFNTEKGEKEMSFAVNGKCEMCKARIEKTALTNKNVKTANWDIKTKVLKLTYNGTVNKKDIEKSIANVGHDTPDFKASKTTYDALPSCCKYDR